MAKRPLSITIIAWFLIATAVFSIVSAVTVGSNPAGQQMLTTSPVPISTRQLVSVVSALIALACGYGMLKGFDWSRYVYVAAAGIGMVINMVTAGAVPIVILGLMMLALIVFFLFRAPANAWFTGKRVDPEGAPGGVTE